MIVLVPDECEEKQGIMSKKSTFDLFQFVPKQLKFKGHEAPEPISKPSSYK